MKFVTAFQIFFGLHHALFANTEIPVINGPANAHLMKRSPFRLASRQIYDSLANDSNKNLHKRKLNLNAEKSLKPVYWFEPSYVHEPLRAAYQFVDTRGPATSHEVQIIDAENGNSIYKRPLIHLLQSPNAYVFPNGFDGSPAQIRQLKNVLDNTENKAGIQGLYRRTANTCPYYVCDPSGASTRSVDNCQLDDVLCLGSPDFSAAPDYIRSKFSTTPTPISAEYLFPLPLKYLAVTGESQAEKSVYIKYTGLPVMAGRIRKDQDGSYTGAWLQEKDNPDFQKSMDKFAEAQAYYFAEEIFSFLQGFLNETSFCTATNQSPESCLELTTSVFNLTKSTGNQAGGPFTLVTNVLRMIPDLDDIVRQVAELGRGTANDPVLIDGTNLGPFDNAFFYPGIKTDVDCTRGSCLFALGQPQIPFVAFGQGKESDWALDQCVAFHEIIHSLTRRLLPDLVEQTYSKFGTSADPGAMNEAWSDYFAVLKCGQVDLSNGWIEKINRNVENNLVSCSADGYGSDVAGQIHHDSQIFSGALWEVRSKIKGVEPEKASKFDQMVITAQALATPTETFSMQFEKIINLMDSNPELATHVETARRIFQERDMNCTHRIFNLNENFLKRHSLKMMYMPARGSTGTRNFVAAPVQLAINGFEDYLTTYIEIHWNQLVYDPFLLMSSYLGYAVKPLKYWISWNCPIEFRHVNGETVAVGNCKNETLESFSASAIHENAYKTAIMGYISIQNELLKNPETKLYIGLHHDAPVAYQLQNIQLGYQRSGSVAIAGILVACALTLMLIGGLHLLRVRRRRLGLSNSEDLEEVRKSQSLNR